MTNSVASRCLHDALIYGSEAELVASVVPFVRAGLAAGDRVLVSGSESQVALFREAVGDDPRVEFSDSHDHYQTPATALLWYQQLFDRDVSTTVRGIRSVGSVPYTLDPAADADWIRYEAMVNRVMAPYPFHGLCLYDTRTLPADLVTVARRTHAVLVTAGVRSAGSGYQEPKDVLLDIGPSTQRDPLEATSPVLEIDGSRDLAGVRHEIYLAVRATELTVERADDFLAAFNEVAVNALTHGRPPVDVRLWCRPDRLYCTVTDNGPGISDPFAGLLSPHGHSDSTGMGLWMARELCDELTISSPPGGGCTVALSTGS
ncbi:MAG: anti-sigma factor RsbA family regulatory protein [Geodermatophilaceae bacterium]